MKEELMYDFEKALKKLDNTLCLNQIDGNLKFGIDKDEEIDCKDAEEMVACIELLEHALLQYKQLMVELGETYSRIKKIVTGE